ncbi:MAG: SDR family oxidoreductase [Elusimicrobia bacterium]|nr:SDR family oxidoreductase [Elusimicrobiota bacterium]
MKGKTAVVTGASRGLGLAVARALLREGAKVVMVARDKGRLEKAAASLDAPEGAVLAVPTDMTDEGAVKRLFERTVDANGGVHGLINNAGAALLRKAADTSLEEWNGAIASNATSAFLACREAMALMPKSGPGGRIVNIASVTAKTGAAYACAYAAAKAALLGLTRSLAKEAAGLGITVNAVCPGAMDTDMFQKDTLDAASALFDVRREALLKSALSAVPLKRLLTPEEVAELVVFLCSDKAAGITGQSYNVCAGYDMH